MTIAKIKFMAYVNSSPGLKWKRNKYIKIPLVNCVVLREGDLDFHYL